MPRALLYYLAQAWTADRYRHVDRDVPAGAASRARHSRPCARAHRARGLPAVVARRMRTVFLLRDAADWPAQQCAAELGLTLPSVSSALQRARTGVRAFLGGSHDQWPAHPAAAPAERALVRRYIDAIEAADEDAVAELPPPSGLLHGRTVAAKRSSLPVRASFHTRWKAPALAVMPW